MKMFHNKDELAILKNLINIKNLIIQKWDKGNSVAQVVFTDKS